MGEYSPYARYQPPYATVPMGLVRLLVAKGVGRNGWAVMAALCCGVHEDGVLDVRSAASVCEMSGLTRNQVARGMAELRERGIIVAVARRNARGYLHPDRSNFGHVAQYCFTREAWRTIYRNATR